MKVGILTFHRAINYGAVLQCYALSETLKSLGHNVSVIDYRPEYIERYRRIIPFYDIKKRKGFFGKLRLCGSSLIRMRNKLDANRRFDAFLNAHFQFSPIVLQPEQMPKDYDAIIFGSDQIWSPQICDGLDNIYWGQFPHGNTRLITYASSLGSFQEYTQGQILQISDYLKNFFRVSFREVNIAKKFNQIFGIKAEFCIDPTLLLTSEQYNKIIISPQQKKYVLLYSVNDIDGMYSFAENIAAQLDSKLIRIRANKIKIIDKNVDAAFALSPQEVLGYFKNASCVIASSFHGVALSIIFRRNFYAIKNKNMNRVNNLLGKLDLSYRIKAVSENVYFSEVRYTTDFEYNLEEQRSSSLLYLQTNLQKI